MSRKIYLLLTLLILGTAGLTRAQKFFEVNEAEKAQVKFFFTDTPDSADLFFCILYDETKITKAGIMMEVETPKQAQITLIFVDDPKQADLKVWMVDTPEEVAWKDPRKKHFLAVDGLK